VPVDPIPEGFATITAHLCCDGCAQAIDFYKNAFGAQELCRHLTPAGKIMHATLRIGSSVFMLNDDFPEMCAGVSASPRPLARSPVTIHLYVEDTDAVMQAAADAGARVTMPAQDMFWGARYGRVRDPFGHEWSVGTQIKDMSSQEMEDAARHAFDH